MENIVVRYSRYEATVRLLKNMKGPIGSMMLFGIYPACCDHHVLWLLIGMITLAVMRILYLRFCNNVLYKFELNDHEVKLIANEKVIKRLSWTDVDSVYRSTKHRMLNIRGNKLKFAFNSSMGDFASVENFVREKVDKTKIVNRALTPHQTAALIVFILVAVNGLSFFFDRKPIDSTFVGMLAMVNVFLLFLIYKTL